MARTPQYQYAMAAGYDQPIGSLTNIELIQDDNGVYVYPPSSFGEYEPGSPAKIFNGLTYFRGRPFTNWPWTGSNGNGRLDYSGAEKIRNDFFGGNWSGSLTVYTPLDNHGVYELCNAVGEITSMPDSSANFSMFNKYGIKLTRIRRITP